MPGDSVVELCGQMKTAPNGETHKCYEALGHDDNHFCCEGGGIWTQDGHWVIQHEPVSYDAPFPDGEMMVIEIDSDGVEADWKINFQPATSQVVEEDSWEDGLY